uniref:Uncharacterized protein n=1 Tax=Accipiter nisus TaxID=211598 RepID=A0A8B9NU92_9AVES
MTDNGKLLHCSYISLLPFFPHITKVLLSSVGKKSRKILEYFICFQYCRHCHHTCKECEAKLGLNEKEGSIPSAS